MWVFTLCNFSTWMVEHVVADVLAFLVMGHVMWTLARLEIVVLQYIVERLTAILRL